MQFLKSILLLGFLFLPLKSISAETDQYFTMKETLRNINEEVSVQLNANYKEALNKAQIKKDYSCEAVTIKVGKKFIGLNDNLLKKWIIKNLSEDMAPEFKSKSNSDYYNVSIYAEKKMWPYNLVALDPNINIGGVYISLDKIVHFQGSGILYYKRYLKALKKEMTEKEAQIYAIKFGFKSENFILGRLGSGVFSYGDMEANFQGFLLYKSFCSGESPRLQKNSVGKWHLVREIDLKNYITPEMDEIFNPSTYGPIRGKYIRRGIKKYCKKEFLENPMFKARINYYKEISTSSLSQNFLKNMIEMGKTGDNQVNSIFNICK